MRGGIFIADRPFAYVCSPYRGDIEANTERARDYCRQVYEAGYIPLAPHLLFPQFLREHIPKEREAGLEMGAALLSQCRVLIICGGDITEGMSREIKLAQELGIKSCALENIEAAASIEQLIAPGIKSDEMLGRFLYDNKMLSEKDTQTANARLSFTSYPEDYYRMMGRRRREAGNGSFTQAGYVENCRSAEKQSVMDRIAASRTEHGNSPNKTAKDKAKKHAPEL